MRDPFGVSSMVAPLRRVAMCRPGNGLLTADPETWHYAGPIDPARLVDQYDTLVTLVEASGARVEWMASPERGLADSVFAFDGSFMTPRGTVLLRAGKRLREPERALHEALHERLGLPILGRIEAPGTVEGGDLLWIDEVTVATGRGFRTNQAGIDQLGAILAPQGITVEAFDLPVGEGPEACLHLLSLISPLDRDLALACPRLMPVGLYRRLLDRGVTLLEAPDDELTASRGLTVNVLATAPRVCIAIDGFPKTARLMRDAGCDLALFPADALCLPCEGGPTCLTLPLRRDSLG